jgi:hypothetical protein
MIEVITAGVGALSLIVVAVVERRTRSEDDRWALNTKEHEQLVARVEDIGSGLGRSLDRVEQNLTRHIEHLQSANELQDKVLFEHLASHAELDVAKLSNESVHIKRRRSK